MKKSKASTIIPGNISLADALLVIAPRDTPSRRRRYFHQFFVSVVEDKLKKTRQPCSDSIVEKITRDNEEVFKQDGISVGCAADYATKFAEWRTAKTSTARAAAAKMKAARAKASKLAKEYEKSARSEAKEKKKVIELHKPSDISWIKPMEASSDQSPDQILMEKEEREQEQT